jgi:hypothetical protein
MVDTTSHMARLYDKGVRREGIKRDVENRKWKDSKKAKEIERSHGKGKERGGIKERVRPLWPGGWKEKGEGELVHDGQARRRWYLISVSVSYIIDQATGTG